MSSFSSSHGKELRFEESTRSFHDEDYTGYDHRFASQAFDSDLVKDLAGDSSQLDPESQSPPSTNGAGGGSSNGPILPPPSEMEPQEGYALREWRRLNALRLEEKEKKEKEMVRQIIEEAEQYKAEFYRKCSVTIENNKKANRVKQKLFLESQEKFHAEADKNYWKAIAELIPREVPSIEKRGKKDEKKKPSINIIQGPKPGKPTDLSRMRTVLTKLKHNPPAHMKPKNPPTSEEPKQDAKTGGSGGAATPHAVAPSNSEAVVAAKD